MCFGEVLKGTCTVGSLLLVEVFQSFWWEYAALSQRERLRKKPILWATLSWWEIKSTLVRDQEIVHRSVSRVE
jgi:hypothetical protein